MSHGVIDSLKKCANQQQRSLSRTQVFAKGLLYLGMNTAGLFIHYLTDHVQRQVFLETRRCIEGRLKLEQENQRQVSLQPHPIHFVNLIQIWPHRSVWFSPSCLALLPWR